MSETIVLDPAEVTGDPVGELILTIDDPDSPIDIKIDSAVGGGVDWGDLSMTARNGCGHPEHRLRCSQPKRPPAARQRIPRA